MVHIDFLHGCTCPHSLRSTVRPAFKLFPLVSCCHTGSVRWTVLFRQHHVFCTLQAKASPEVGIAGLRPNDMTLTWTGKQSRHLVPSVLCGFEQDSSVTIYSCCAYTSNSRETSPNIRCSKDMHDKCSTLQARQSQQSLQQRMARPGGRGSPIQPFTAPPPQHPAGIPGAPSMCSSSDCS